MPIEFLYIIVALSWCKDESVVARLCRSPVMVKLGDISMAFYLIHILIMILMMHVFATDAAGAIVPSSLILSLLFGFLFTKFYAEPLRKILGRKKSKSVGTGQTIGIQLNPHNNYAQAGGDEELDAEPLIQIKTTVAQGVVQGTVVQGTVVQGTVVQG